ncbi:hypothetical protein DB346_22730 [Verrucomicrobia bacterium LW23]|nr:hypothetical protein DB346_22730 [Verrucomicrobia bacterium LW23]
MELRHLRYFVAVADELSFTKAAQKLKLAQPSLTRQVKNLESELGVELFDRSHNRVSLTEPGRRFLSDSRHLLSLAERNAEAVRQMKRQNEPHLKVGYIANRPYGLLAATLNAFRKHCPGIAIHLHDLPAWEQIEALEGRTLDIGYVGSSPPRHPQLHYSPLCSEAIVAAIPSDHPLSRKSKIRLQDLSDLFFIDITDESIGVSSEWTIEQCQKDGFDPKYLQKTDKLATALQFVSASLGVALIPAQFSSPGHNGVSFHAFDPELERECAIAWLADNRSTALQLYIAVATEVARNASGSRILSI